MRLTCEVSGTGTAPSVLLLHGWGSSASVMRPIAMWLEKTHTVVNLDLPGHGRSPKPPSAWGVPENASLVRQVINQTIDGPFSIIGHSNGGRIALFLASEDGSLPGLEKMILFSPSGVRRKRTLRYYVRISIATILKAPFQILPGRLREFTLDWLRHSLIWRLLGSSDYRNAHGVMRESFVKTVNCYIEERLSAVRCPVLLFRGCRDDAITQAQVEKMEQTIPDAGLVHVEGAGHYAFLDRPNVVRAAITHFLTTD